MASENTTTERSRAQSSSDSWFDRMGDWFKGRSDEPAQRGQRPRRVGHIIPEDDASFPDPQEHAAHPGNNVLQRWANQS